MIKAAALRGKRFYKQTEQELRRNFALLTHIKGPKSKVPPNHPKAEMWKLIEPSGVLVLVLTISVDKHRTFPF